MDETVANIDETVAERAKTLIKDLSEEDYRLFMYRFIDQACHTCHIPEVRDWAQDWSHRTTEKDWSHRTTEKDWSHRMTEESTRAVEAFILQTPDDGNHYPGLTIMVARAFLKNEAPTLGCLMWLFKDIDVGSILEEVERPYINQKKVTGNA